MRSLTVSSLVATLLCGVLPLTVAAQNGDPAKSKQSLNAVEKIRQELGKKITLDFTSQNFLEGIDHLRQKAKLSITVDRTAAMMVGIPPFENQPTPVHLKSDNEPVRLALQRMLRPYGLTYIILNDGVFITTERLAYSQQMKQGVSVHVDNESLAVALKNLARETGANLVIDPGQKSLAMETKVTLKLEDTNLETAARLLTEMCGLKLVQVGSVMFVTDTKKAAGIRLENLENQRNSNQNGIFFPPAIGGIGGFGQAVPPPPVNNPAQIKKAPPAPPQP